MIPTRGAQAILRLWRRARRAVDSRPRLRRALVISVTLFLLPWALLAVAAALTDLPEPLAGAHSPDVSLVVRDRSGVAIREYRAKDGMRARWVPLSDLGDRVPKAILAAEDLRFFHHPGVDPIAMARAAAQALWHRRLVSGASTLTQQLARTVTVRPRTVHGKLGEMALAVRIEASLSKEEILEQYANRVSFGPGLRGIEAASRFYFDKPARDLSLSEAAALAGMPRGPSLYDPRKGTARILRRRDTVLERMRGAHLATDDEIDRALAEPLIIAPRGGGLGAPHLVLALTSGKLDDLGAARASDVTLTLDRGLQRTIEVLAQDTVNDLRSRRASAAAVVVLENETGDILAYLGSHDFEDEKGLGQNDGVLMQRQPGSSLKPFVYGLAMERLGFTAATMIPDVETHFVTSDGDFAPNNYDGRFHGPVLLREALGCSYNVPAVRTAAALGEENVLARLRDLGFSTLTRSSQEYGVALALGDGETRLLDLANAYATIARSGRYLPVHAVRKATLASGGPAPLTSAAPRQILDPTVALILADILSDDRARAPAFGRGGPLDLPFPVAAKTGTSKGYRDNIAVGFTREVTVAVWVGNFDGSPMEGVSGVSGAGPLFHGAMIAAQALYPQASRAPLREQLASIDGAAGGPAPSAPPVFTTAEICPLSGMLRGPDCPHSQQEIFPASGDAGKAPTAVCDMHVHVRIDRRNGLRAGKSCPDAFVEQKVFESHPADLAAWAKTAHRPLPPTEISPLCPLDGDEKDARSAAPLRLAYPPDGASFVLDPHIGSRQSIVLRAQAPSSAPVLFMVDAHPLTPRPGDLTVLWPLTPGAHRIWVESAGRKSDSALVRVDTE